MLLACFKFTVATSVTIHLYLSRLNPRCKNKNSINTDCSKITPSCAVYDCSLTKTVHLYAMITLRNLPTFI